MLALVEADALKGDSRPPKAEEADAGSTRSEADAAVTEAVVTDAAGEETQAGMQAEVQAGMQAGVQADATREATTTRS